MLISGPKKLNWIFAVLALGIGGRGAAQSFSALAPNAQSTAQPALVASGDLNGDGRMDLVTAGYPNGTPGGTLYLEAFLGSGAGTFSQLPPGNDNSPAGFVAVDQCASPVSLKVASFSSSGTMQAVLLCSDTLQIWHMDSQPAASSPIVFQDDAAHRQVIHLAGSGLDMAIADLTGAGQLGVAVLEATDGAGSITYYLPDTCSGTCVFNPLSSLTLYYDLGWAAPTGQTGSAIAVLPVRSSAYPALVVTTVNPDHCGGVVLPLLYDIPSQSFVGQPVSSIPQPDCARALTVADLDGDGKADLVVAGPTVDNTAGFLLSYVGAGDGTLDGAPTQTAATSTLLRNNGSLLALDLNGDGKADVLAANPVAVDTVDRTAYFLGAGDGSFGAMQSFGPTVSASPSSTNNVQAVTAGDINADGAPDVVSLDLVNGTAEIGASLQTFTGRTANSTVSLAATPTTLGATLTVTIAPAAASGFVQFYDQTTGTWAGSAPIASGTALLSLNGTGTHFFVAFYYGDATYNGSESAPVSVAMGSVPYSTATTLSASPQTSSPGTNVRLSSRITTGYPGGATGTVTFTDNGSPLHTSTVSNNRASFSTASLAAGTHSIVATYSGDAHSASSASGSVTVTVLPMSTTTLTLSSQNITAGSPVTMSATVVDGSGAPVTSGTVSFVDQYSQAQLGSANLDASGTATVTLPSVPRGTYDVVAQYPGTSVLAASNSSDLVLTASGIPSAITFSATPGSVSFGSALSLSTQVTGGSAAPTGQVQVLDGTTAVATLTLTGGAASGSLTTLAPGSHLLRAAYAGDAAYLPVSSAAVSVTVHGGVLQIAPGAVYTLAGTPSDDNHGSFGGDGGAATAAHLHTPAGVTTDSAGSVYIADEENNVIRKVTPDGLITTVAGIPYVGSIYSTRFGGDGGPATSAYLDNPAAVAIDAAGDLFIADYSNNVVRRVDATTGIITTYAGNAAAPGYNGDSGAATAVHLNGPSALAFDAAGNLYIADSRNNLVRRVDTSGQLTTVAGSYYLTASGTPPSGVPATSVALLRPMGVAIAPDGSLYISDTGNGIVRRVDGSGTITTVAGGNPFSGGADNVIATSAQLSTPSQLAFDRSGNLYIAEQSGHVVRRLRTDGILTTAVGTLGSTAYPYYYDPAGAAAPLVTLASPSGVAVDAQGGLLVTDNYNQTVLRVGPTGALRFGPQATGTSSAPQTVTLRNTGDQPVTFFAPPTVTGEYVIGAADTGSCDFSGALAAGAECSFTVTWHPQSGGDSGIITLPTAAAGGSVIHVTTNENPAATATLLYVSSNQIAPGDTLTLLAQVQGTGFPATGNVSFFDNGVYFASAPLSSSIAELDTTTLIAGSHSLTATYSGDSTYAASTSNPQTVMVGYATQTAVTSDNASPPAGTPVTFTATVTSSGTPVTVGSVRFYDSTALLGTANVNASGQATLTTSTLAQGSHPIVAVYSGSGPYAGSSGFLSQNVGPGAPQPFDYTIAVAGLPAVIARGSSATVSLTLTPANATPGVVTLDCGVLPDYASCSFSQQTIAFSSAAPQTVTLTISTTAAPGGAQQSLRMDAGGAHGMVRFGQ